MARTNPWRNIKILSIVISFETWIKKTVICVLIKKLHNKYYLGCEKKSGRMAPCSGGFRSYKNNFNNFMITIAFL